MPTRLCLHPRCPNPATHRGRCPTHSRARNRDTHQNKSIYNSKRWQILRRHILYHQPLCGCGMIATDVDHITPIEQGGDPYNPANLQALCHPCHSRKTSREMASR
jgi:5-methylcytosine-specific restriction protein A